MSLPLLTEEFGETYRELWVVDGRLRSGDEPDGELPQVLARYGLGWPDYDRELVARVV